MKDSKDDRFTGGNNLKGFENKITEIMMQTELMDGKGAYEVLWAGQKNSGLTFGGNQMDLSMVELDNKGVPKPEGYQKIFSDILENAKDLSGDKIINDSDHRNFKKIKYWVKGKTPAAVFGELLPKVNEALSSKYGQQKIDEVYVSEIKKQINYVKRSVNSLSNAANRDAILANEELMLRLVDFHNQFGITKNGKMEKFLNGHEIELINYLYDPQGNKVPYLCLQGNCMEKRRHKLKIEGLPTVEDLIKFIRSSDQYHISPHTAKGVETRLKKLEDYFIKNKLEKTSFNEKAEVFEIGNMTDNSLSGNWTTKQLSLNFKINLDKLKTCVARIKYHSHGWLIVNGYKAYEFLAPDVIKSTSSEAFLRHEYRHIYHVEQLNGKWAVVSNKINNSSTSLTPGDYDIKPFLRNHNNATLYITIPGKGCAYMKIIPEHNNL